MQKSELMQNSELMQGVSWCWEWADAGVSWCWNWADARSELMLELSWCKKWADAGSELMQGVTWCWEWADAGSELMLELSWFKEWADAGSELMLEVSWWWGWLKYSHTSLDLYIRVGNSTTPESMMGYLESMFFKMTHTHTLTHTVRFQIIHKHCVGPRFFTNTGWVCICGAVCQVIHESRGSQIWFCFVITQNT